MSHEKREKPPIPIFDVGKWTYRMIIAASFGVLTLVLADPRERPYLIVPGAALATLGCLLRLWGTGHLNKNKVLATGGPYAHIRHPLYIGTLLIMVGLGLMAGGFWVLCVLLPVGLLVYGAYYAPKKERVESKRLEKNFGDVFREYKAAVHGYFPRLTPYPGRQGRFMWDGVIRNREYLIDLAVLTGMAVIVGKYFLTASGG